MAVCIVYKLYKQDGFYGEPTHGMAVYTHREKKAKKNNLLRTEIDVRMYRSSEIAISRVQSPYSVYFYFCSHERSVPQ